MELMWPPYTSQGVAGIGRPAGSLDKFNASSSSLLFLNQHINTEQYSMALLIIMQAVT